MPDLPGLTYAGAGVSLQAADEAVARIRDLVGSTWTPDVISDLRGFAGLYSLESTLGAPGWSDEAVLVASTDGVGTKALVASTAQRYGTIGVDLVASLVDDVVTCGARPLFLLDYLAVGQLDPGRAEQIVAGVASACSVAGAALLGGEIAEHPGALEPGTFDLAGCAVGIVRRSAILGPARVRRGDALVGLASPGLRCNGYSLARRALAGADGPRLDQPAWEGAAQSLADELLRPSVLYAPVVSGVAASLELHAAAHITGGGIPGNLARVLPEDLDAVVRLGVLPVPRIFSEISAAGPVEWSEMVRVFNLGIGFVLVVAAGDAARAVAACAGAGCPAAVVGEVVSGTGRVRLQGVPA